MILCNIIVLPTTKSFCTTRNYSILSTLACVTRIMRRGNSIAGVKTFCVSFSYKNKLCNYQVFPLDAEYNFSM